jgi:hypothetical protein
VLDIRGLEAQFRTEAGVVRAVDEEFADLGVETDDDDVWWVVL